MSASRDAGQTLWTISPQVASVLRLVSEHEDAESKRIGELIARLRGERGWNQMELATKLGVHVSTVSRWERGQHEGYAKNVQKLAETLKVQPALLRPSQADVVSQLDRIEEMLTHQGDVLDVLAVALEAELGDRFAAAVERARRQARGRLRAEDRRGQGGA